VELVLEQLHGLEVPPAVERIDCPLIVRASTGPAPTR
jgi:LacI family transcriptional regulator